MVVQDVGRRVMNQDEQRDTTGGKREEDPRRFEKTTREVREEQSPSTGDEGTEEDRQEWEMPRDISEEVAAIPEEASEQRRQAREDQLEAPPGD
jgi:hypothetical protein